jgi:hypothetical protein
MKTYILHDSQTVEPQNLNPNSPPPRPEPGLTALVDVICGRPVPPPPPLAGRVLFIGLDVPNDSIAVSLAPSDSTEVRRYGIIGGEHDDVLKLVKKLQAAHPGTLLKFCYEAGPRGFALCRCLRAHGLDCILVCPSKVPRKPGERVKTDRRDNSTGGNIPNSGPARGKLKKEKTRASSGTCPVGHQAVTGARSTPDSLEAPRDYPALTFDHPSLAPLNAIFFR